MMNTILKEVKGVGFDRVIAVGGGTVIDISKLFVLKGVEDVTEAFVRGARISMSMCNEMAKISGEEIEGAILKANSPSCGSGKIYDGTFSGVLTEGSGVFASMLAAQGIEVITEKEKIKW